MRAEDYDWFLDNPSDYMIRAYLPKIIGVLTPLTKLPPIHGIISHYQGLFDVLPVVGKGGGYILNPEVPLIDENPENVRAMTDFFKKHGVYQ